MRVDCLSENSSIFDHILEYYPSLRMRPISREQALDVIFSEYKNEYNDDDEKPYIVLAIAIALSRKNELTAQIRSEALQAVKQLRIRGLTEAQLNELTCLISDEHIGPEAEYKRRKMYDPKWKIGDTFIHPFSHPKAMEMGLSGHFIVLRKVGEYLDQAYHHIQLVYVTTCSAGTVPKTDKELRDIGFLRMFEHDNGWDYLGQLYFKGKKDEEKWQLIKIGCFPEAGSPSDAIDSDPLVAMSLFGPIHRDSSQLDYEGIVCSLIKRNGISL